jgi:hypothetical protein
LVHYILASYSRLRFHSMMWGFYNDCKYLLGRSREDPGKGPT